MSLLAPIGWVGQVTAGVRLLVVAVQGETIATNRYKAKTRNRQESPMECAIGME